MTSLSKSFYFRTHTIWNALPLQIRENSNLHAFKEQVTKYLWKKFREYNSDEAVGEDDFFDEDLIDNG